MTHSIIKKNEVNIYECPAAEITNATQLCIGDLHANAMFLMHFLVSNGVVKISADKYEQLKKIYLKKELARIQA